ncbi:hypothetical protein [Povalibacter sp.]|uniref:hypothetical protein n=1 Tax=Povalibacter sp. TaxID=1962978 RepID=UPI002F429BE1
MSLLLFVLSCLLFTGVFRKLSAASLRTSVRIPAATLLVFAMMLAALWVECTAWSASGVLVAAAISSCALPGQGLERLTVSLGRWRFSLYLLSIATLAALVFVYVPITTFLTSPGELSLHLDYLITVNSRNAMLVVYLAALVYAVAVIPRIRTALTVLALIALALGMVYSYFIPFGYPMMTGLTFEQVVIPAVSRILRIAADIVVVIAIVAAITAALVRWGGKPFVVATILINVSLIGVAAVGVLADSAGEAGGPDSSAQVSAQPLRFSKTNRNVLIVFLDRFMGSYVEDILRTDPDLNSSLSGFVWYPRTVSAGENSIAGVHPMYGGYDYTPTEMNARDRPLRDLSVEAFSILPYNFSRKNYDVNFVGPRGLGFTMAGDCKYLSMDRVNCTHIPLSIVKERAERAGFPLNELSRSSYADLLVLLASMRGASYLMKDILQMKGPWRPYMDHSAGTTFREWAELEAFPDLTYTGAGQPNLNIVSNILAHEPYYLNEQCVPQQERLRVTIEEIRRRGHDSLFSLQHSIGARCTLLSVARYLDFLKRAEVYDNTKIVIVSDHGIVGPVSDHSSRAVAGGTQHNEYVRTRSVLLVKEVGATGDVRISEAFMPNAEVPRIVCEEIGGCVNPYLGNKTIEAHGRDDPFYAAFVPWQFNAQNPKSFVIRSTKILKGQDPYDAQGWAYSE